MAANFSGSLMQPREDIGGAKGELGGVTNLAKNVMYERWWRKELEDFDRVAIPKMKEAVTKLGELANDENFTDHGGAWAMMKGAVSSVQNEALKYPNNPYISMKSANMHKALSGSFQEMTQGLKDMQTIATSKEQAKLAEAKRTELMPQQIATSKTQQKVAEAELARAERGKARITDFGPLRGHAQGWPTIIQNSPAYSQLHEKRRLEDANDAWAGESGQAYRDQMGVMAKQSDFIEMHSLDDDSEQQFNKQMYTSAVKQLGEAPDVEAAFINDMIRSSPVKDAVDDAKKPVELPVALRAGTTALNRIGWNDPAMGEGSAADFRPEMLIKHRNSIYGKVLAMYARLRTPPSSLNHQEAKEQIFTTGTVDIAVNQFLNTSNKAGQDTVSEFVKEIDSLLEAEEESFMFTREEEERQRLLQEGAYGGALDPTLDFMGDVLDYKEWGPRIWQAGKESLFGKQIDPAAQEYLQRVKAKGEKAKPGASPAQTVPPRIIESE